VSFGKFAKYFSLFSSKDISSHSCALIFRKGNKICLIFALAVDETSVMKPNSLKPTKFVTVHIFKFFVLDEATTSFSDSHNESTITIEDSPESLEQKNYRGAKIARRARSFKDDFLEKISQMRTPTNTISR
jgi:hypothetical protein